MPLSCRFGGLPFRHPLHPSAPTVGVRTVKPSERSLEGVMAELKALRQAYGAAQRRCTATVQRLHARNQLLEAEVLQLRAQLAAREPSLAMAGDEQRRM